MLPEATELLWMAVGVGGSWDTTTGEGSTLQLCHLEALVLMDLPRHATVHHTDKRHNSQNLPPVTCWDERFPNLSQHFSTVCTLVCHKWSVNVWEKVH